MTTPLTSEQAIALLREHPEAYQTREQLRALAAQVDADAAGRVTVLYSGPSANGVWSSDVINAMLENGEDVRVINRSEAAKFLRSDDFYNALAKAYDIPARPLIEGTYDGPATKWLYHPTQGPWADASARFADATIGEVRAIVSDADPKRTFGAVEVPHILANPKVTTIEGIPREALAARQASHGPQAAFEMIVANAREDVGRLNVAVNYAATPLRNDSGRLMLDSRAYFVGTQVEGKAPAFTTVTQPLAGSMTPPTEYVLAGQKHLQEWQAQLGHDLRAQAAAHGFAPGTSAAMKGLGALGATVTAYEGKQTFDRHQLLEAQGNPLAAQSEANHYLARMIGGWTVGTAGAVLGSGAGPGGTFAGGAAGGVLGERAGERLAARWDAARIYQQTVRGVDWEFNGRAWTRAGEVDSTPDAIDNPRDTRVVASFEQARELNALASNKAVELALGAAPPPKDPFRLPASDADPASLNDAPWLRDAQTGQWHRQIKTGMSGENNRGTYEQHIATPERAAQLDQQAAQVVWQNIASGPAAIAAQYQLGHRRQGMDQFGEPQSVQLALAPERLQASDKTIYTRNADGAWVNGQTRAEGNLALELETTRGMLQASLAEHRQQLAAIPNYAERLPEQMQSEQLAYRYRVVGTELTPEWQQAIELASARTRQAHGLDGPGSVELRPNAQGQIAADSPIAHLQRGADGVDRIVAITSSDDVRQALKDVQARGPQQTPVPDTPERRIEAQTPQEREAYAQVLHEANRQGVSTPQAEQIATLAAVQVRAPGREDRQEPTVEPAVRQDREPALATEQPTRSFEPTPVIEPQAEDQQRVTQARAQETQQPTTGAPVQSQAAAPGAVAPELQDQVRMQAATAQQQGVSPPAQKISDAPPVQERQPEQPAPTISAREPEQPAPTVTASEPAQPSLRLGDRGPDVEFLQHRLQRAGATGPEGQPVPQDGTYGVETEHAVREFQQANNLPTTGVADQALDEALARVPQVRQEPRAGAEPAAQATPEQVIERPSMEQREVQAQAVSEAQRLGAAPEQVQQVAAQVADDRQQGQPAAGQRFETPELSRSVAGPSLGGGARSNDRDEQQELTPRQSQTQSFPTDHHDYTLFVAIQSQLPKDTPDEKTAEIMRQAKLGGVRRADQLDEVVVENDRVLVFGKTAGMYSHEVSLGAPAPSLNETLQRSQDYDQQQALQMQQFQEQQARINQNQGGPTLSM